MNGWRIKRCADDAVQANDRPCARNETVMRLVVCAGLALGLAGCIAGCTGPLENRDARVSPQRLRQVEALKLDDFRKKEAAGAAVAVELPGPGTPAAEMPMKRPPVMAGESVEISLEQVRASAVANNLSLKVEVVSPSIVRERENAERAKFEAVFRPSMNLASQNDPSFNAANVNTQQRASVGGGVDIPLRSGGRTTVELAAVRNLTQSQFVTDAASWSTDAIFSISQPLLRGGGEVYTTASIRIAAYQTEIAEAGTRLAVINTLAQADRAYWLLYAVRRELDVRQQQYELAVTQWEQAKRKVEAGSTPEIEVTRAESGIASSLEAIVVAEANVLLQQRELKRLANIDGLDVATATQIKPMKPPEPVQLALDTEMLQTAALLARDELLQVELQILADAVGIDFSRNNTLPQIDVSASAGLGGLGRNLPNAGDDVLSTRFKTYRFGLNGQVPIGNQAAESQLRESILTRLQRIANKANREQTVRKEVLDAVDRIRSSWQRILAARQASILAERTLRGEQRQFEAGSRTSTDVLDAAARLANAQSSEIRALTEYENAKVDLAAATGTVLGSAGVQWQAVPAPKTAEEQKPFPHIDD